MQFLSCAEFHVMFITFKLIPFPDKSRSSAKNEQDYMNHERCA